VTGPLAPGAGPPFPGPVLAGTGLCLTRGGRRILDGVDLAVHAGERLAVMGPSGSGKTSLLALLAGIERPDAGTVRLDGRPLTGPTPQVAPVLQGHGLLGLLTVAENVQVAVRAAGRPPAEALAAWPPVLERLALDDRADHLVEALSGGQQQRVAVARALAVRPRVLLADEPTAEQDAGHRDLVIRALLAVTDAGGALVVATHDELIAARCDRVVRLSAGTLAAPPSPP